MTPSTNLFHQPSTIFHHVPPQGAAHPSTTTHPVGVVEGWKQSPRSCGGSRMVEASPYGSDLTQAVRLRRLRRLRRWMIFDRVLVALAVVTVFWLALAGTVRW